MKALVAHGADPHAPTKWPEIGLRGRRQQDGRIMDDSGIPRPEGMPNMYPIHAAAGGGYMGLGSWQVAAVPNNFLNTLKYLVEEHGADVNLPDSWGYTPLHYVSVRGGNDMIEYLVSKGAEVGAISVLGQSPVDMARGVVPDTSSGSGTRRRWFCCRASAPRSSVSVPSSGALGTTAPTPKWSRGSTRTRRS